jgi:hypothetical protein
MIAGDRTVEATAAAQSHQAQRGSDQARAMLEVGLIVCAFVAMFFLLPHDLRGDDITRLRDINQLLHHGRLPNSRFSLVMPLISVPVLILDHVTQSRSFWASHFNTIVVAVGVLAAYRLLRGRVDPRLFRLIVLVLLCASFLANRLRDYNAETLTATLVTLGIICLATNRYPVAGWAAIVLGVVNTPAAIIGLILMAGVQTVRTRQLRQLVPVAAAAALIMLEAWIRRGSPFSTGYEGQRYSYPFLLGFASLLFSFGRGLLFFTPGLALWLNGRARRLLPGRGAVALMLVFLAGLILIYSKWWSWYGGLSWGPRFFTFAAIPASVMVAAGVWRAGRSATADALTLGVLALSAWVALSGAITDLKVTLQVCRVTPMLTGCFYKPQTSSLWLGATQFPSLTLSTTVLTVIICAVVAYLAAPLAANVVRALLPRRSWAAGWRI